MMTDGEKIAEAETEFGVRFDDGATEWFDSEHQARWVAGMFGTLVRRRHYVTETEEVRPASRGEY